MQKELPIFKCPCNDFEFEISYKCEDEEHEVLEIFCPICGAEITDDEVKQKLEEALSDE